MKIKVTRKQLNKALWARGTHIRIKGGSNDFIIEGELVKEKGGHVGHPMKKAEDGEYRCLDCDRTAKEIFGKPQIEEIPTAWNMHQITKALNILIKEHNK